MLDNDCDAPTDADLVRLWRAWAAACDANDHRAEVRTRLTLEAATAKAAGSPLVAALREWERVHETFEPMGVRMAAMAAVEDLVDAIG